ncbi:MAG: replication-associated recombination protein A [Firmicutes bacterium]|nr:replication-associated recombination protein A [Bacillota bacterium]
MNSPLADRLRPKTLDEILGHEKLVGRDGVLSKALENGELFSFVLWGPPGTGKTTLARAAASFVKARFLEFSAVSSGVADVRRIIDEAKKFRNFGTPTILFMDEIHRFNKAQQDTFLPYVEDGTILLIGATTENPFFELIPPLLSRLKIFKMELLSHDVLEAILKKGERALQIQVDEPGEELLILYAAGDGRRLLNALESTHQVYKSAAALNESQVRDVIEKNVVVYDKSSDYHYDVISAFIKALRGSDPDAALHWLARMIAAGEDPRFIARRMIILASEDIGNADPLSLVVAISAAQGVEFVGMPEAQLVLAHAACYLAAAPKSNACYLGLQNALKDIEKKSLSSVPLHLRNAAASGMKQFGIGVGYRYPHDYPSHFVDQKYFPEGWEETVYYHPSEQGKELKIKKQLEELWIKRRK